MARKKKKSGSGVLVGSAISAGIVILIIAAVYLKTRPAGADDGTGAITEANLAVQTLPDKLPSFGIVSTGEDADAEALFAAAIDARRWVRGGFNDPEKQIEGSKTAIEQLIAAGTGKLEDGFIDKQTPDKAFESREVKQSMESLGSAVKLHVEYLIDEGEFDEANEIARAYFAFGRQAFDKNLRLKARQRGLGTMKSALRSIGNIAKAAEEDGAIEADEQKKTHADVMKWLDAIKAVEDKWNAKLKTTESTSSKQGIPNIADLTRIANDDKDRTFRVWAARRLGYAIFERGDQGNQAAINKALDALEQSDDKLVAEAAKAGRSIKDKAEYHELRK